MSIIPWNSAYSGGSTTRFISTRAVAYSTLPGCTRSGMVSPAMIPLTALFSSWTKSKTLERLVIFSGTSS